MKASPGAPATFPDERTIVNVREFGVPPERVFAAWTAPDQIERWWGPSGFTNTFEEFDPRPGGAWRFVMHGPDGTNYPNESRFVEIEEPVRIVIDHVCAPLFRLTATFTEIEGGTRLEWSMRFAEAAAFESVLGIVPAANEQNLDRLAAVLAGLPL